MSEKNFASYGDMETLLTEVASKCGSSVSVGVEELIRDTVGRTGKNLLVYPYYEGTEEEKDVTFTDNGDGTITLNGTSSGSAYHFLERNSSMYLKAGDYILSGGILNAWLYLYTNDGTEIAHTNNSDMSVRVRISSDGYYRVSLVVSANKTFSNVICYPMLRHAEIVDDTYEVYHPPIEDDLEKLKIQLSVMPTASATYAGKIVQFVGTTDATYTHGYYYECANNGGTYTWTRLNVQPSSGSGTGDYPDLTNKPQINDVTLEGNKSASDLGLMETDGSNAEQFVSFNKGSVSLEDLPVSARDCSAIVYNNKIYMFSYGNLYIWDGVNWRMAAYLPIGMQNGSALVYNDEIHIFKFDRHYKFDETIQDWVQVSSLPVDANSDTHFVIYKGEIHLLYSSNIESSAHYKYNISTCTWVSVSTLPYEYFAVAVVYNNAIHLIGGANDSYDYHYRWNGSTWASVETLPYVIYSGKALLYKNEIHIFSYREHYIWDGVNWIQLSMANNVDQCCEVVYKGLIHLLGGNASTGSGYDKKHLVWYHNDNVGWVEPLLQLPYNFYRGAAVVYNNDIHLIGGVNSTTIQKNHYALGVGNGGENAWTSKSTLSYAFYDGCAVVYNNEIHVLGSSASGQTLKHYKYNNSAWASVSTLPYEFNYGAAVVFHDYLYILGGTGDPTGFYRYIRRDESTWDWRLVSSLPYDFIGGCAVVYNDELHILGGSGASASKKHYVYRSSTWKQLTDLPYDFYTGSAVVHNGYIHIFGGYSANDATVQTKHYRWSSDTTGWEECSNIPYNFYSGSVVEHDEHVCLLGSLNSSALYNKFVMYKSSDYEHEEFDEGYWSSLFENQILSVGNNDNKDLISTENLAIDDKGNVNENGCTYWKRGTLSGELYNAVTKTGKQLELEDGAVYFMSCNVRLKSTGAWYGMNNYVIASQFNPSLGNNVGASTTGQGLPVVVSLGASGTVGVNLRRQVKIGDDGKYHSMIGFGSCTTDCYVRWSIKKLLGSEEDFI